MHRLGIRDHLPLASTTPIPLQVPGCALWLDASQESYSDLDADQTFTDWSGNGRNYAAINGITYRTGITPLGTPVMRYASGGGITGHESTVSLAALGWTEAEIFVVTNVASAVGPNAGPGRFGNQLSGNWYPFAGSIYCDWFSTTRYNFVPSATLTNFNVVNVYAGGSSWDYLINGSSEHSSLSNTFGITNPTYIGSNTSGNGYGGDVAEIIIYDNILSGANRAIIEAYLQSKHIA